MKNYLMRAAASPFENPEHIDAISKNLINGNTGNLVFTHSISRALMLEDVNIDYMKTDHFLSEEEAEKINSRYDCFIIPLANALRPDFVHELRYLTDMVSRLDMPCIVIGIGFQGKIDSTMNQSYPWDDASRRFISAVLEKSSVVGLRGEMTAKYLEHLGFEREHDFTVIGCPSMYLYGEDLPHPKPLDLSPGSRINLNCKVVLPQKIHDYMHGICEMIPDHYYIPQNTYELKTVYSGIPLKYTKKLSSIPEHYPMDMTHRLYKENRICGFVSAESWMKFLAKGDMNFGTRIHGNIAGILAGVPVFVVAPDSRVLELSEYHNIPHTTIGELDTDRNIFELIQDIDYDQIQTGHKERFRHYLKFMNDNGLDTIFNKEVKRIPFDEKISDIDFLGPIMSFDTFSSERQIKAMHIWTEELDKVSSERDKLRSRNEKLRYEVRHPAKMIIRYGMKKIKGTKEKS